VGFARAFRRSELVGLDVADLKFQGEGLLVTLQRSKTDKKGKADTLPFLMDCMLIPVLFLRSQGGFRVLLFPKVPCSDQSAKAARHA
jgi:hypothetical protein